ncbi:hypothetical protein OIV83_005831 [Microbotryomycetes sp. JL201]|nr:hypothetical protein OIV83_005831 [Microbotryomycetes sp. JL201]
MVPNEELPILEQLVNIRMRLTRLKKDRTDYLRQKDVFDIYGALMNQVHQLNEVRAASQPDTDVAAADGHASTSTAPGTAAAAHEDNRVDTVLNDVFSLLSLFFLRIGKSRESPATFCQLSTMKRLLTHLNESGIYTEADLKPYQARLAELKGIIVEGRTPEDAEDAAQEEALRKLLLSKWAICGKPYPDRLLKKLVGSLSSMSTELAPLHQRLITLRRLLASIAARPRPTASDVANILAELRQIDDSRALGNKFVVEGSDGEPYAPEKGQELLAGLLEDNFEICQDIQAREAAEDVARGPLQPIYDRLSELRAQLERLVLTHRWTLRETDLYNFQMALQEIDNMRVDGKFRDSEGNVPEGQLVLLYLLRRCYGLCYRLMSSSEPISEELMPVANKLTTVKRCLIEVAKHGGPYSARDLYPYQLALAQIDNLRVDGRFEGHDGSCPEGQAILNALLSEAHEIVSMMQEENEQIEAEERAEETEAAKA